MAAMSSSESNIFYNGRAQSYTPPHVPPIDSIHQFHRSLKGHKATPLRTLDSIARKLGVKDVFLKDESNRYGLPSFKILGASWAISQEVVRRLDIPRSSELSNIKSALEARRLKLFAATDGNHGRAVARIGLILGIEVEIHVPAGLPKTTIELIRGEEALVVQCSRNYDGAIQEASDAAKQFGNDGVLIQDFSFGDYRVIPQWIVDGYSTMFHEVDQQLHGSVPDVVVVPVGVGSFAQAVVTYFKHRSSNTTILAVEPETAACLHASLLAGRLTTLQTSSTIMNGLECGTVSEIAWPILRDGIDASMVISDYAAHECVGRLRCEYGIEVGPCGAAGLAAVCQLSSSDKQTLRLSKDSTILLLCTEGQRDYDEGSIK